MGQKFKEIQGIQHETNRVGMQRGRPKAVRSTQGETQTGTQRERDTQRQRDSEKFHNFHAKMTETLPNFDAQPSIINNTTRERQREFFSQGCHIPRIMFSDRFYHQPKQKILLRREILSSLEKTVLSPRERETFSEDSVAPSVDPCAIVASDCLQRVVTYLTMPYPHRELGYWSRIS